MLKNTNQVVIIKIMLLIKWKRKGKGEMKGGCLEKGNDGGGGIKESEGLM